MTTQDQRASRADLYRVAAFLRELDRMLHPATGRPAGGYRLPPAVLPPLPPTGYAWVDPTARQSGSGWMTTRTAQPVSALATPEIDWVEPAELPLPARAEAPDPAGAPPLLPTPPPRPAPPAIAGTVAEPETAPSGPARAGPVVSEDQRVAPLSSPAPEVETRSAATTVPTSTRSPRPAVIPLSDAVATPELRAAMPVVAPEGPDGRVPPVPREDHPGVSTLPAHAPQVGAPPQAPRGRRPRRAEEPARLPPAPAGPVTTTPPVATAPTPHGGPVDLVIDGIDGGTAFNTAPSETTETPEPDDDVFTTAADDPGALPLPGPPPLPEVRGPRRALAQLPAATAHGTQFELQRRYLDRTLRRSR